MEVSESWYSGIVNITLKEAAFEPSLPLHHACELGKLLHFLKKSILCIYTNGGSDHSFTFLSVKIALVCLLLDLDYLLAARTVPYHSWCNPMERIMSTLNLGLLSVGIKDKLVMMI